MALVNDDSIADRAKKLESLRMTNVSSRLTRRETDHLDELAKKHRLQRGEFIRQLILDELERDSGDPPVSAELVEIIGVRLMLTNLLKPLTTGQKITPEVFDGIIAEVKSTNAAWRSRRGQTWRKTNGKHSLGTKRNDHFPAAQRHLHLWRSALCCDPHRTFRLTALHLRQHSAAALLHADLHPVERCGQRLREPQRQVPPGDDRRSRNPTATSHGRGRGRREHAGTGNKTAPACALKVRLAGGL